MRASSVPDTQQADNVFPLSFHPFTNFPLFSKVQRTIPSWLAYVPKSVSCHYPGHTVTTVRPHQTTCCIPNPPCFFLSLTFWNPFLHCVATLSHPPPPIFPHLQAWVQVDSIYSEMCFLIPRRSIHGSNTPFANTTCHLCLWMPIALGCGYSGPPCLFPSLYPLCLGEWALSGRLCDLVQSLILLCD